MWIKMWAVCGQWVSVKMSQELKYQMQALGWGILMVVGFCAFVLMLVTGLPFEPRHY
jgi:hypothetical protein